MISLRKPYSGRSSTYPPVNDLLNPIDMIIPAHRTSRDVGSPLPDARCRGRSWRGPLVDLSREINQPLNPDLLALGHRAIRPAPCFPLTPGSADRCGYLL